MSSYNVTVVIDLTLSSSVSSSNSSTIYVMGKQFESEMNSLEACIDGIPDETIRAELREDMLALIDQIAKAFNSDNRRHSKISLTDWNKAHELYIRLESKARKSELDAIHAFRLKKRVKELLLEADKVSEIKKYPGLCAIIQELNKKYVEYDNPNPMPYADDYAIMANRLGDIIARKALIKQIEALEDISEEELLAPFFPKPGSGGSAYISSLRDDIIICFSKIESLSPEAAAELKSFYEEALSDCTELRLDLIRTKFKSSYAKLREQSVINRAFKEDAERYIPLLKRFPKAEHLLKRIEHYIGGNDISRPVYSSLIADITRHLETSASESFFRKIHQAAQDVLTPLGYKLIGDVSDVKPGRIQFFDSPHDGYRVAMNITDEGKMTTRLVRVVGSEAEKQSVSAYQKQKDAETTKKWCETLRSVEERMLEQNLHSNVLQRLEPGDEGWELPIIVDAELNKQASVHGKESLLKEQSFNNRQE